MAQMSVSEGPRNEPTRLVSHSRAESDGSRLNPPAISIASSGVCGAILPLIPPPPQSQTTVVVHPLMRVRYEAAAAAGMRGSSQQHRTTSTTTTATQPRGVVGRAGATAAAAASRRPRRATTARMRLLLLCSALAVSTLLLLVHSPTTLGGSGATALAGSSEPFAQRLQHLQATSASRVASQYGIAAGYWQLDLNYSAPAEVPLLARPRYAASNASCWALAARHAEAFSSAYQPTQQLPMVRK